MATSHKSSGVDNMPLTPISDDWNDPNYYYDKDEVDAALKKLKEELENKLEHHESRLGTRSFYVVKNVLHEIFGKEMFQ